MSKLEFLILDEDYSNIIDFELIEAEFVFRNNEIRLNPKLKGYYKSRLIEISNLLLASSQKPDEILDDVQEQVELFRINNNIREDNFKIIVYEILNESLKYYCLFKISAAVV